MPLDKTRASSENLAKHQRLKKEEILEQLNGHIHSLVIDLKLGKK
jgi:hypothetical protein